MKPPSPGRLYAFLVLLSLFGVSLTLVAAPKTDKEPAPHFIRGKVVLFEFWTTWCGYCAEEAGFVDQIAKEFSDKGLIVLAVNVGESRKTVKNISTSILARFPS